MEYVVLKEYSSKFEKILYDKIAFETYLGAKALYEHFIANTKCEKFLYYEGIVTISIIKDNGEDYDVLDEEIIEVGK